MEPWEACFFVLILDFTFGKDISSNSTSVIRKIDSCPDVGYFFKLEQSLNLVDSGPCYLCFCKDNEFATCWERDRRRCDVERYHHHRVGRQSRPRRSFANIFFRDATRDFFGKNLPTQCKPYESSFSDGCPPADWCIGCTICDCDDNGHWDCHILSFCDGKESKKKVKLPKHLRKKKNSEKDLDYDNSVEARPRQRTPVRGTSNKMTPKPKRTTPLKKKVVKVVNGKRRDKQINHQSKSINLQSNPNNRKSNPSNRPNNTNNGQSNPSNRQSKSNNRQSKTKKAPKKSVIKPIGSKKQASPKVISKNNRNSNVSRVKNNKKVVAIRKSDALKQNRQQWLKLKHESNNTVKLGQTIVKHVMENFKKMLAKKIEKLNETDKMRILNGKFRYCDTGEEKKDDEDDVPENHISENRNDHNRQSKRIRKHTNDRTKREIQNHKRRNVEKKTVISLPTDVNAVIPPNTTKEENSSSPNLLANVTLVPLSISQQDNYYKYSINKNDGSWTSTTKAANIIVENKDNDIVNNLVISTELNNDNTIKNIKTKATISDINYLLSKWYAIKNRSDEQKRQIKSILRKLSTTKPIKVEKKTDKEFPASKLQKKYFKSKHDGTEKYDFTTLASIIYRKPFCTKTAQNTNSPDVDFRKNIVQNQFTDLNITNKPKRKHKSKISVKYFRNFLRKIFSKIKTGSRMAYGLGTKEDHTLQILCENIGPCIINKNSKNILKQKLKQLNKETKTVLKSISTVKGLLHLLELPNWEKNSYFSNKNSLQNDIQKLSTVLKDYKDGETNPSLTFTQKMQIGYIKNNTQTFIESVKQFADILTDIIALIKPNNIDQPLKPQLKQQNNSASFNKIKKMLYKYNILQNTFMRRMYKLIRGEERKATAAETIQTHTIENNQNRSENIIDKYSKNIIENLRKLKTIARVLSSKRKKREVMGDDALEYLLMLMEMLIKQKHPAEIVQNNDGIDFLIDAIKNAPEIKPIQNKDLNYESIVPFSKETAMAKTSVLVTSDSESEPRRIFNEESAIYPEDNAISQDKIVAQNNGGGQDDDISQNNAASQNNGNSQRKIVNEDNVFTGTTTKIEAQTIQSMDYDGTQKVYYRKFNQQNNIDYDYTTEYNSITKKRSNSETERTGFDKFESYFGEQKKLDLESYGEDDTNGYITTETGPIMINETDADSHILLKNKASKKITENYVRSNESSSESQDSNNEKKTKLEWIEETFDREIRMVNKSTYSTTPKPTTTTTKKPTQNISDISEESHIDATPRRPTEKSTASDVLYEKHVQFLNSLDYGTEKSADFEETESKDDNRSDDVFPAYFV